MSVARARHMPIRTALSGPAAGAVGAIHMARLSGVAGCHFAGHGRHQRGRRADAQLHGGHDVQQMDRGLSGAARLAGHQCGRRGRRLDRVVRPRRPDENGPAERGRATGPGLLRAWWPRGHCHRREPRARALVAARAARRRHGARRRASRATRSRRSPNVSASRSSAPRMACSGSSSPTWCGRSARCRSSAGTIRAPSRCCRSAAPVRCTRPTSRRASASRAASCRSRPASCARRD